MAKISGLSQLTTEEITGNEIVPVVKDGATRNASLSALVAPWLALVESLLGPPYPDEAAGLAATNVGESFAVNNGDGTVTIWYHDAGDVAAFPRTLATTDYLASSVGGGAVGLDDGSSGSLFTTVQGLLDYLRSPAGSSILGVIQSGTGAVPRRGDDKALDFLNLADFLPFNYSTNGSQTYTAELQDAVDEAKTSGRTLWVPPGSFFTSGEGIDGSTPNDKSLTIKGDNNHSTFIKNADGPAMRVGGQFLRVADIGFWSEGGDAAIRQIGPLSLLSWRAASAIQLHDDFPIWDNDGFEFVNNRFFEHFFQHTVTSTVHAFNLVGAGGLINNNVWYAGRAQNSGFEHFYNVESTSANAQYSNKWEDETFEVCLGGGIRLRAANSLKIGNCVNWDADAVTIRNHFYDIDRNAYGINCSGEISHCIRNAGSMAETKYDVSMPGGGGGAGIRIISCASSGGDPFTIDAKNNAFYRAGLMPEGMTIINDGGEVGPNLADGTYNTAFGHYEVAGNKVVGAQGAAVTDAADAASAITQLNALLARMRAHGLIAT